MSRPPARRGTRARTVALAVAPALTVGAVWAVTSVLTRPDTGHVAPLPPPATVEIAPVAATSAATGAPTPAGSAPRRPSPAWVTAVAARTGIPARALQAYGTAQLTVQAEDPGCHLGWTTLAGIGAIESDHGRHAGSAIGPDGVDRPTVLGPALDGTAGNRAVPDTDGGQLDGDTTWDRAVGPMQFIPSTWRQWGRSVSGGVPDPSNVDDAVLTAAVYLCASGEDMATPAGWTAAIATYNAPFEYAVSVSDAADTIARRSAT